MQIKQRDKSQSLILFLYFFLIGATSLKEAQESYLLGEYQKTIQICSKIVRTNIERGCVYLLGLSYLKVGNYSQARRYFQLVISEYPKSPFYNEGLVKLGDTYFLEGNFDTAEKFYTDILKKNHNFKYRSLLYFRLAQISAKKGDWQNKHRYLNILNEKFPQSIENKLADRLRKMGNFFTVQVGAFAHKKNALTYVKRLEKRFPVYIVTEKEEELLLYKVRIGKYPTRLQAERVANILREEGFPVRIFP